MNLLARYITKTTLLATALITVIIGSLLFVMSVLGELKNIGQGDYGMLQVLYYVILRLPTDIYHFFPMLILLGSILGLSTLSASRELAVMRASGFSMRRIIVSVLIAAFTLTITITFLSEWFGPVLSYHANINKENAKNAGVAVVTATGVWFHVDNNFIHVDHVVGKNLLQGVTRYEFDNNHHLQTAYHAKTMINQDGNWEMKDVVRTVFSHDRTKSESFAEFPWDLTFNASLLNLGMAVPKEMSLTKLVSFSHYLKKNGLQANQYDYEFWQRLFQPLASLIMIFLAIPFVLSTFSTSTLGWQIIIGILLGFSFFILNSLLGQLCIVFQLPALFAALIPLIIFAIFGSFLSKRMITQ